MIIFVYEEKMEGSVSSAIVCYTSEQVRSPYPLIGIIDAEETDADITTSWSDPNWIQVGEVFRCNDVFSNLIRTK